MPKYLIFNQPPAPVPKSADVKGCVNYFLEMQVRGKARIYPVVGMKGYATFVDVANHQELINFLKGNPMGHIERYKVYPLGDIEDMKY
jgi:hypothetical protein